MQTSRGHGQSTDEFERVKQALSRMISSFQPPPPTEKKNGPSLTSLV